MELYAVSELCISKFVSKFLSAPANHMDISRPLTRHPFSRQSEMSVDPRKFFSAVEHAFLVYHGKLTPVALTTYPYPFLNPAYEPQGRTPRPQVATCGSRCQIVTIPSLVSTFGLHSQISAKLTPLDLQQMCRRTGKAHPRARRTTGLGARLGETTTRPLSAEGRLKYATGERVRGLKFTSTWSFHLHYNGDVTELPLIFDVVFEVPNPGTLPVARKPSTMSSPGRAPVSRRVFRSGAW